MNDTAKAVLGVGGVVVVIAAFALNPSKEKMAREVSSWDDYVENSAIQKGRPDLIPQYEVYKSQRTVEYSNYFLMSIYKSKYAGSTIYGCVGLFNKAVCIPNTR